MITTTKYTSLESISLTKNKNIIVALNTLSIYGNPGGFSDRSIKPFVESFAGFLFIHKIVPQFGYIKSAKLGDIFKFEKEDHTYWGFVCFDSPDLDGIKSSIFIKNSLDKIYEELKDLPVSYYAKTEAEKNSFLFEGLEKTNLNIEVYL